jgi:hypothetical protein
MRIFITVLVLILNLSSCKAQNPAGVWICYDNYIINPDYAGRPIGEGLLIDFDDKSLGHIRIDTFIPILINFDKSKISINTDTLISLNYKLKSSDSLEIDFKQNMVEMFKPLELNFKLQTTKDDISEFLINNDFEDIGGELDIEFSDEFFSNDKKLKESSRRKTLINNTLNAEGYWYIRQIKKNFFLVCTFQYLPDIHIFQILGINECKLELKQIKLPGTFSPLTNEIKELRTCL